MTDACGLRQRLAELPAVRPNLRGRDAAQALGVSEAELVAGAIRTTSRRRCRQAAHALS